MKIIVRSLMMSLFLFLPAFSATLFAAPAAPANFGPVPNQTFGNELNLQWDAVPGAVQYIITVDYSTSYTINAPATRTKITTGIVPNSVYALGIIAKDSTNTNSPSSNIAVATPCINFSMSSVSETQVTANYACVNSSYASHTFELSRNSSILKTTGPGSTTSDSYNDTNVLANRVYTYTLRAVLDGNEEVYTRTFSNTGYLALDEPVVSDFSNMQYGESSGGIASISPFQVGDTDPSNTSGWHLIAQATRLTHTGDPSRQFPVNSLTLYAPTLTETLGLSTPAPTVTAANWTIDGSAATIITAAANEGKSSYNTTFPSTALKLVIPSSFSPIVPGYYTNRYVTDITWTLATGP